MLGIATFISVESLREKNCGFCSDKCKTWDCLLTIEAYIHQALDLPCWYTPRVTRPHPMLFCLTESAI